MQSACVHCRDKVPCKTGLEGMIKCKGNFSRCRELPHLLKMFIISRLHGCGLRGAIIEVDTNGIL